MTKQLLAAALCLLNIAPGVLSAQAAGRHDGSLTDPDISYVGRWDKSSPVDYHSYWTAPYLRVGFTGTLVKINLTEPTTLNVSIDGAAPQVVNAGAGETALNSAPLAPGRHTLLVGGEAQNQEMQFKGLTLDPGAATFFVPARPLIEFIGDSITAGGADNYAWLTGEALGGDHTQIAFSGVALTSGYGCSSKIGQDVQYFRLKNYNHASDNPPVPWNMSYTPQVIVINLGQNDQCGSEPADTMTASYAGFLLKLRVAYPQAHLVALRTFGGPYEASIKQAVAVRTAAGDSKVHYIDTTGWLQKDDLRDGIHPNDGGNVKVAKRLTPLLRPLLNGAASAPATTVTVGDPKNPGALPQQVLNAYLNGVRHITVRPGTYLCPNTGQTFLSLNGWKNALLDGTGATLILTDKAWMHDGIDLNRCDGVTVQGFLLSQNQVTSYQGRVVSIGKGDDGKRYADWRPDAGYPMPPATDKGFLGASGVNIVDAHTRLLKAGNGDYYGASYDALSNGLFRVHIGGNFGVGDWMVGRYGDAPFKIHLSNSRNCIVKDITLVRNGFAPLREEGGGGNRYLRITWMLGPRPSGATEYPVVTNAADGMHMTGSNPGPDIEDCRFEGVFLDDCIAIHGYLQTVTDASGLSVTLKGGAGDMKVGQPVRISDDKGFFAEGLVMAIQENKATGGKDDTTTLTLDKDYKVPTSAKLSNPHADGMGFKIIGCHLGSTRSRGILAKADNGLIRGNVLEHCGMSAISLGPEYYWGEADYAQNVVIENNTIRNCGQATYGGAAILVHGDGAVGNKNIVIRNNKMIANLQGDMDLQWVAGVTIVDNTLTAPKLDAPSAPTYSAIALGNCRDIVLQGNVVQNAAAYKPELVAVGPTVLNVEHNDPSGIRVEDVKAVTLASPAH